MSKKEPNNKNFICIVGDFAELDKIRSFVKSKALSFGFPENEAHRISLAVDEACTNLIQHAYKKDKKREICINIEFSDNCKFIINILDDGAPFNPLDVKNPDMKTYFNKFKRGGLGIHIIKLVMDEITYIPSKSNGSKNILKLMKSL